MAGNIREQEFHEKRSERKFTVNFAARAVWNLLIRMYYMLICTEIEFHIEINEFLRIKIFAQLILIRNIASLL